MVQEGLDIPAERLPTCLLLFCPFPLSQQGSRSGSNLSLPAEPEFHILSGAGTETGGDGTGALLSVQLCAAASNWPPLTSS